MVRSLIAVVVAAVLGVATAKFVENAATILFPAIAANSVAVGTLSAGYTLALLASWGLAALVASAVSLLIGRRWAPLGWLAAASMLLLAVVSALSGPSPLLLLPGAVIVTGAGGLAAVKLLKATTAPPIETRKAGLF